MLGKKGAGVTALLCDTHALIWLVYGNPKLGPESRALIGRALSAECALFSAASAWEFATLRAKKNPPFQARPAELHDDLLAAGFREVPLTGDIALAGHERLRAVVADPADYFIAATALKLGATLLTADALLLGSPKIPAADARK